MGEREGVSIHEKDTGVDSAPSSFFSSHPFPAVPLASPQETVLYIQGLALAECKVLPNAPVRRRTNVPQLGVGTAGGFLCFPIWKGPGPLGCTALTGLGCLLPSSPGRLHVLRWGLPGRRQGVLDRSGEEEPGHSLRGVLPI